jgi:hypothetical protein
VADAGENAMNLPENLFRYDVPSMAGPSVTGDVDRGHRDDRRCGQSLLKCVILRLAVGQTQPPSVVVDHDGDVIGVGEC